MRDKEVLKEETRCRLHFPSSSVVSQMFCRNLDVSDGGGLGSDSAAGFRLSAARDCEGCLTCDLLSEEPTYCTRSRQTLGVCTASTQFSDVQGEICARAERLFDFFV